MVIDVGCGAGGMGAAFAEALPVGGTVVLIDAEPELLRAATAHVRAVGDERVDVRAVPADAADDALLEQRCLPWDVGIGEPGLQGRLSAARGEWFRQLGTAMEGAVRLPVGWNRVLTDAGLVDVSSFSYLIDRPAPPADGVRAAVLRWLSGVREVAEPWLSEPDLRVVGELLDENGPHYVGRRDDVFVLAAHTVHVGTAKG